MEKWTTGTPLDQQLNCNINVAIKKLPVAFSSATCTRCWSREIEREVISVAELGVKLLSRLYQRERTGEGVCVYSEHVYLVMCTFLLFLARSGAEEASITHPAPYYYRRADNEPAQPRGETAAAEQRHQPQLEHTPQASLINYFLIGGGWEYCFT